MNYKMRLSWRKKGVTKVLGSSLSLDLLSTMFPAVKNKYIKPIKTQFRGLGLGYTFRLGYMPYKTGKGIMYLISRKIEFKFSFQPEKFFFSVKSHFSFLFGVFLAFLPPVWGSFHERRNKICSMEKPRLLLT